MDAGGVAVLLIVRRCAWLILIMQWVRAACNYLAMLELKVRKASNLWCNVCALGRDSTIIESMRLNL